MRSPERNELAVHVQAQLLAPLGSRLQVTLFGGPSFFRVEQELVTSFNWSETHPFDDAGFDSATTSGAKGSSNRIQCRELMSLTFSPGTWASVPCCSSHTPPSHSTSPKAVPMTKAGGTKAGGGLRVRF